VQFWKLARRHTGFCVLGLLPGCTGFPTGRTDAEPARVNEVKSARLTTVEGLCDSLVGDLMRVGDFIMNSVVVVVVMRRGEQARKKEEGSHSGQHVQFNRVGRFETVCKWLSNRGCKTNHWACALKRKCRFFSKHVEIGTKRLGNSGSVPKLHSASPD
jgi:hypothetical protein